MHVSRRAVYLIRAREKNEALGVGVIALGALAGACAGARFAGGGGAIAGAMVGGVVGAMAMGQIQQITFAWDDRGRLAIRCEFCD